MTKKVIYVMIFVLIVQVVCLIVPKNRKKIPQMQNPVQVFNNSDRSFEAALDTSDEPPTFKNIASFDTDLKFKSAVYNIDKTALTSDFKLDLHALLEGDVKTNLDSSEPKILIFHSHANEKYIDSRENEVSDTVVGVGAELARILTDTYGVSVVHDVGVYDFKDGENDRENSYKNMKPAVLRLLEKYPTVEVLVDIHRDGVPDNLKLVTNVNNTEVAKIMLFNGINVEHNEENQNTGDLNKENQTISNPFVCENLSLSLKLQLTANEIYPGLMRKIYLRPNNHSLHLAPKSLLVEVGANTNTVSEAMGAMKPFAHVLYETLSAN